VIIAGLPTKIILVPVGIVEPCTNRNAAGMWTFAIKECDLRENRLTRVYPGGVAILLIRKDGALLALASNCPHMGCSLGGAIIDEDTIQCPCHDWKFDISTGRFTEANEIGLEMYPLKSENGDISINL
jgi:nitrite reductase/ring-hydroxylating ferredoxin subunit